MNRCRTHAMRVPFTCQDGKGGRFRDGYVTVPFESVDGPRAPVALRAAGASRSEIVETRLYAGALWSPLSMRPAYSYGSLSIPPEVVMHGYLLNGSTIPGSRKLAIEERRPKGEWCGEGWPDLSAESEAALLFEAASSIIMVDGSPYQRSLGPAFHVTREYHGNAWRESVGLLPALTGSDKGMARSAAAAFRWDRHEEMAAILAVHAPGVGGGERLRDLAGQVQVLIPDAAQAVDDVGVSTVAMARLVLFNLAGNQVKSVPRDAVRLACDMRVAFRERDGDDPFGDPYHSNAGRLFSWLSPKGADAMAPLLARYRELGLGDLLNPSDATLLLVNAARQPDVPADELDLEAMEGIGHAP